MNLNQINKEVLRLEAKVSFLCAKLRKIQSTEIEIELQKTRDILYNFYRIQALLNN